MCNKKSIKEIKYNTKKKTTSYKEQCKEKVNKYLNEIKNFSEEDIVYIDETGIQGYIYREYARAIRGKKVYDKIPGKKYKRTNIVAGKCGDKIISPLVYDKIMDSKFFEKWFKEMFLNEVEKNILRKTPLIFGCDECQKCCPFNENAAYSPLPETGADRIPRLERETLEQISNRRFTKEYGEYVFSWRGRPVLLRNMDIIEKK